MDNKSNNNSNSCSCNKQGYKTALVIFAIISLVGLCFGIYGTIQANQALNAINKISENSLVDSDLLPESETFGVPSSADSIEYIAIDYDDYSKSIFIDKSGSIELYTSAEDEGAIIETDTSELIQYMFDNGRSGLTEYSMLDNESWSVIVSSQEGVSYINGEGEMPEWLKQFISKAEAIAKK